MPPLMGDRDLLTIGDLDAATLHALIADARAAKADPGSLAPILAGRTVLVHFTKASTRTRLSVETAVTRLGGHPVFARADELQLGRGEPIADTARVVSRMCDAIVIRTFAQADVEELARHADIPVVNALTDDHHPLQALADLMTMRETLGSLTGKKLCISWTRSPQPSSAAVTNSLLLAALRAGMQVHIAHPEGYDLDEEISARARAMCGDDAQRFATGLDAEEAVQGAHIVYARSWASTRDYGNPTLAASRRARLSGWMVDAALMRRSDGAKLMHAMPVRRNIEVSDEVLDGPQSLVYEQAENRLHSQKALLVRLLRG